MIKKRKNSQNFQKKLLKLLSPIASTSAFAVTSCVSSFQSLNFYSTKVFNSAELNVYSSIKNTANFFKTPKSMAAEGVDIRYKDYFGNISPELITQGRQFRATVNKLTKQDLKRDLIDSLIEIVNNNQNISIDFSKIDVEKDDFNDIVKDFNLLTNNQGNLLINAFQMVMRITNSDVHSFNLMDGIEISARSSVEVKISLPQGKVVPSYTVGNDTSGRPNVYAGSWNIEASSFNFIVTLNYTDGDYRGKNLRFSPGKLKLLTSRSFAINTFFNQFQTLPSYDDVQPKAIQEIANLNSDQLLADINDWYTTYSRFYAYKAWKDIELILKYFLNPSQTGDDGRPTSLLKIFVENTARREEILRRIYLPKPLKDFMGLILNKRDKYSPPTTKQLETLIRDLLALDIGKIIDEQVAVKIDWYQKPVVDSSDPKAPRVSFNFNVKWEFKQDFNFWFSNVKRVEKQNEKITLTNKELTSQGKAQLPLIPTPPADQQYDLNNYVNVNNLISLFGLISEKNSNLNGLIGGLGEILKFDQLFFAKGESININYYATNSLIQFVGQKSIDNTKDSGFNFGWQATDVQTTINLSELPSFWEEFYKRLNAIDYSSKNLNNNGVIANIGNIKPFLDEIKDLGKAAGKADIKQILNLLSLLFVAPDQKNKSYLPRSQRDVRPVEKLFDALIASSYSINSIPMSINLSRAFYYLANKIDDQLLWIKTETITSSEHQIRESYVSNNNLLICNLIPTSADTSIQVSEKQGDENNASQYENQPTLSLFWKNEQLRIYNLNFTNGLYSSKSLNLRQELVNEKIDQLILSADSDEKLLALGPRIVEALKQNLVLPNGTTNTSYYKNLSPKVSFVRIPLKDAFNTIMNMPLQDPIKELVNLARIIKPSAFDFSKILDNVFQRDLYFVIINTQISSDFFWSSKSGTLSSEAEKVIFKLVPPLMDFSKIQVPSF